MIGKMKMTLFLNSKLPGHATQNPGIFPTESISQFDKKTLHPFFTRLP